MLPYHEPVSLKSLGIYFSTKWFPLHKTWASLVAQMVKNLPTMQETQIRSLGWEDSPGEGNGYPLQYSCSILPFSPGEGNGYPLQYS